jgi:hypothetical protein
MWVFDSFVGHQPGLGIVLGDGFNAGGLFENHKLVSLHFLYESDVLKFQCWIWKGFGVHPVGSGITFVIYVVAGTKC